MPVAGIQRYMTPYSNVGLMLEQSRREQENSREQKAMDITQANTLERQVPSGAQSNPTNYPGQRTTLFRLG